jgi:transcriptional regulator with XRE-family HTH domain
MPPRERHVDRGGRRATRDIGFVGFEIRTARLMAGLTMAQVGSAVGLSASQVSRIERGVALNVSVRHLGRIGAAVGLDVRVRAYPGPDPIRDASQVAAIDRLRRLFGRLLMRIEVPIPVEGDQRAWDAVIVGLVGGPSILPVEVETRIHDLQAQARRISLKARDAGESSILLVVADTRTNRRAIAAAAPVLEGSFPVPSRTALAALAEGRHPGGSALVFL